MRSRVWAAVAGAAVLAVGLAGCVGIPASGSVNPGPVVGAADSESGAQLPSKPPKGASRNEILTDFMQAVVAPDSDYGIARAYLTPAADRKWDPTKSVLIREGAPQTQSEPDGSITYNVTTKASIDGSGIYSEQSVTASQPLSFSFQKVGGQWRISSLADGIVISRANFSDSFVQQPLYFYDPTYSYLVPDVRWFPPGSTMATRVVNALLAGPSSPLQGGVVVSAFPQGVKQQRAVELASSTATVDLSADAASVKAPQQARMLRQLQESLSSSGNISAVAIDVGGAPLQVTQHVTTAAALAISSEPLVVSGKKFGFSPKLTDIGRLSSQIVSLDPSAVSVSRKQTGAAVLAAGGVYQVSSSLAVPRLVDARRHLIAPSIDPFGYIWSVPSTSPTQIRVTSPAGQVQAITSPVGAGARIVSLQVSHDGTRLLAYLRTASGPLLAVVGIVRTNGSAPTGFGSPVLLPVSSATPVDATWVDAGSVATLGTTGGHDAVTTYTIGGTAGDTSIPVGAAHIVGGSGIAFLRLITDSGQVLQLRSSGWQELGITASVLATQQ